MPRELNCNRGSPKIPKRSSPNLRLRIPHSVPQRTIKLPIPTQDAKVLLKLAQLDLTAHPPHAPGKKIRIEAKPARVRFTKAGLFQPLAPGPAKLEITMARLRAVVGETDTDVRQRVGFPALLDSHRPDHFHVAPPGKHKETRPSARLSLRRFRPVIPARVEISAEQSPVWIGFAKRKARVTDASGPWSSAGECGMRQASGGVKNET
jgi:protein ImuB